MHEEEVEAGFTVWFGRAGEEECSEESELFEHILRLAFRECRRGIRRVRERVWGQSGMPHSTYPPDLIYSPRSQRVFPSLAQQRIWIVREDWRKDIRGVDFAKDG